MSEITTLPLPCAAAMQVTLAQLFAIARGEGWSLHAGVNSAAESGNDSANHDASASATQTMIDGIATDSRKVQAGDLFIALRGDNFDAHDFLDQVAATAGALLVSRLPQDGPAASLPCILVPDTKLALGRLGHAWRMQFALPLIGVTGSNGKTTVKEMIAAILAANFGEEQRLATRGNLNNDFGVPLTLLNLRATHTAGVVELGMNHPGEIAYLADLTRPLVALINNAQREHLEFMQDVASVARENGSVIHSLDQSGTAVFPSDEAFTPLWRELAQARGCKAMTFGLGEAEQADVSCDWQATEFGSRLQVRLRGNGVVRCFDVTLAVAGLHNVRNALAAIACTSALGIDDEVIARGLEAFQAVGGRLQRKNAFNGAMLIDDTYNANPDSVRAAIAVLAQSPSPRLLVLGDMGEVGDQGPQFHQEVGQFALQMGIDQVFCLGALTAHTVAAFGQGARHFAHLNDLQQALNTALAPPAGPQATILVKGSRFMKMERVVQYLMQAPVPPSLQQSPQAPDSPLQGMN
jgi:UDP-N-acetylmuramoyl-tripeptide--D-alanyl-D-alanine ligase